MNESKYEMVPTAAPEDNQGIHQSNEWTHLDEKPLVAATKTSEIYYTSPIELGPSSFNTTQRQNTFASEYEQVRDRLFNRGWKGGLIRCAIFSTGLWLLMIIAYIYLYSRSETKRGSGVIMTSSCSVVSKANTIIHAALNIVTTLMLGASTYAMESLCCPTREEVDAAHAKKLWLGIGGLSLRNFRFISKSRSVLWVVLWITSIPLHLFFNAVFFTSSRAHQYAVAVVTPEYFSDTSFTPTASNSAPENFHEPGGYQNQYRYERPDNLTIVTLLQDARVNNGSAHFAILDRDQCMSTYANGFVGDASDVVVVINDTRTTSPLVWTRYPLRMLSSSTDMINQDGFNWICHDVLNSQEGKEDEDIWDRCQIDVVNKITKDGNWTVYGSPVEYCLSRPYPSTCDLFFNIWLMLAVLIIGMIKTAIILYICIRLTKLHNLRTFGDAIVSFLQREDKTTKGLCLVPSSTFVKHGLTKCAPQIYTGQQQRWWKSAGVKQFWITIASTIVFAILFGIALSYGIRGAFGTAFDFSLGRPDIQALASVQADDAGSSGVIPNLIVANLPQLGFSVLYIAYNDIFSKMLMGHEFDMYTKRRKGLRISERTKGKQLGTRYFSLPAKWALPMMAVSALAHWLTSQGLFPIRIDGVDNRNVVDTDDQLARLGYNARAVVALIVLQLFVVVVALCIGWFRKLDIGFGEVGNSLVISAACHPPWNDGEMHLREVAWGEVTNIQGDLDVRHCSFWDQHPKKPSQGMYYS